MAKKRPILLLAVLGAALGLLRKRKAQRAESDLWSEATTSPDLR